MKIALLQSQVYTDKSLNLKEAYDLSRMAADQGADIAILPEMFSCPYSSEYFKAFAEEKGEETYAALSKAAAESGIVLVGGSMPEKEGDRLYNTSFVFDAKGNEIARHRKTHLFDINIEGGQKFMESDTFSPGDGGTLFEACGHTFGLAICFDIRFAEMFRELSVKGAEAIFVPASFNMTTGPMHWEISFRMRAVDNQLFMIGCAPARDESASYVSYANSIVCDPWGKVLCNAGTGRGLTICEIDLDEVKRVRAQLPIMKFFEENNV